MKVKAVKNIIVKRECEIAHLPPRGEQEIVALKTKSAGHHSQIFCALHVLITYLLMSYFQRSSRDKKRTSAVMLTACRCALLVVYLPPGNGKLNGDNSVNTQTLLSSHSQMHLLSGGKQTLGRGEDKCMCIH